MTATYDLLDIKIQFETQGFFHLKGVIPPDILGRAHRAFDAASERHAGQWKKTAATKFDLPAFFDIPAILDQDDAFIDLVDLPTVFPILTTLVGDDIQLNHTSARLFPPGRTFTSPFHSDLSDIQGINLGESLNFMVKVHYYIEDLAEDQGCLAFIPGSHRYPAHYRGPKNLESDSDAVVKIVPKAGDAVVFNTHTLHMALDNTSDAVRKSIIYAYSHFWVKNFASAVPRDTARFAGSEQRKQLFGVDQPGVSHFNRRLGLSSQSSTFGSVLATGKNLVRRALPKKRYA